MFETFLKVVTPNEKKGKLIHAKDKILPLDSTYHIEKGRKAKGDAVQPAHACILIRADYLKGIGYT